MAEEALYDQIETGDPDPLGLRKKLAGTKQVAPDPLGLRSKLAPEKPIEQPQQAFQINISQPTFKSAPAQITREFTDQKQKDELAPLKLEGKARTAYQAIQNELIGNKDVKVEMIKQRRFEQAAGNVSISKTDMPKTQAQIDIERLSSRTKPQDLPITEEDLAKEDIDIQSDRGKAVRLMEETMKKYPEKAKEIQKNLYTIDAFNSLAPDQHNRVPKIEENAKQIAKGNLIYDARSNRLIQPLGLMGSAIEGWKQKSQLFADYDFLKNTENDAAITMDLEDRRNRHDMDTPMPVPKGKLSEITQMLGATPIKPILGGAIASLGGPQAGMAAGAIIGGREFAKLEYAATFQQVYNELRDKNVEKFEAVRQARSQAENAAEVGAVTGGAMGLVGAKLGAKPLTPMPLSNSFKQAAFNVLKSSGHELGKAGLEGLAVGGLGAAGQVYKNQLAKSIGIERPLDEGVAEQIEMGLLGTVAMAAAIKAGRGMTKPNYRNLLHGLSKMPEEQINGMLQEKVQNGEITQKAADETQQRINEYKGLDLLIPENVNEEARFKIQDKIQKRQEYEQQLESQDKAYHPEIKEKIKTIDEEIVNLTKEGKQKIEKPASGLTKEQEKEATELAEEWLHEGLLPDTYEEMIKKDPIGFWKMIAQQAQNRDENWRPLSESLPEEAVRDQFGDTVVDYAKELFPAPEIKEPLVSVTYPKKTGTETTAEGVTVIKPEVESTKSISVIQPGEIKHPETITIKPKDNAIQEEGSLSLPEKQYGEPETDKDLFPEKSQTQPRINRKTAADIIGEDQAGRLQTSLDWLEAIERNDPEKSANAAQELVRQSMAAERQVREVLGSNDRRGAEVRAQGDNGGEIGTQAEAIGTRSSQESKQSGQPSGQSATTEPIGSQQSPSQIKNAGTEKSIRGLSKTERKSVVKKVQELSKLRDNTEKASRIRSLRNMLEQSIRKNPSQTKEIIDLITENTPDYGTIRERIAKETFMGEASRNREKMGAREPGAEGPTIPQEPKESEGTGKEKIKSEYKPDWIFADEGSGSEKVGITHAAMDDLAREFGFDTYEKFPETVPGWDFEAAKRLREDPQALNKLFDKLRRGDQPDHIDNRMMLMYMADLKAKITRNPSNELLNQFKRTRDLFNIAGREWGKAGRARQGEIPVEETLGDFLIKRHESNEGAPLTEEQIKTTEEHFKNVFDSQKAFDEKVAKSVDESSKAKAEEEIKKTKSTSKKQPKKDYKTERQTIVNDIREKLRKARGETQVVAIPYAKELISIAPDVAKLVKNLIEDGIDQLPDIVKNIHGQLKEFIEDIKEQDVVDIIAGKYNEKKQTRNYLAAKLFDVKKEAQLMGELEQLLQGERPRNDKKLRQYNIRIEKLKEQIKELKGTEVPDSQRLTALKVRYKKEAERIEKKILDKDFAPDEKPKPIVLDKEAIDLKDRMIKARIDWESEVAREEFNNRTKTQKFKDLAADALDAVRTMQTNPDMSFMGRQGIKYFVTHPIKGAKVFWESAKQFVSEKRYDRWLYDIHNSPTWKLIQDSGLAVLDPHDLHASKKEEGWRSKLIHKIPAAGQLAKASERAFTSAANMARVDWFMEGVNILRQQGKTWENSPEEYKAWASVVNNMTGRGGLGKLEPIARQLAIPFWSPRLIASNVNLFLNPYYYYKMPKTARIMLLKNMAQYVITGGVFLGAAAALGAEVELDPRSSDFGKIKVGNTRYDIWGGASQYIRVLSQLLTTTRKRGARMEDLKARGLVSTSTNFMRSKLSPAWGFIIDAKLGTNVVGEPVEWADAYKLAIPMLWNDIQDAQKDGGPDAAAIAGLLSFLGIGAQTYTPKTKAPTESKGRTKPTKTKRQHINK